MASLLRRPRPDVSCTPRRTVRWYTALKLIFIFLIATIVVVLLIFSVRAPSLQPLPPVVLAGDLLLGGRGTAGSTVELRSNGRSLGRTNVAGDGRWQHAVTFAAGAYELKVMAIKEEGPPISGDAGLAQLTVVDVPTLELSTGSESDLVTAFVLSGRGSPGSTLRLLRNEEPFATIVVGGDGTWAHQGQARRPSESEFRAEVLDGDGAPLAASGPRHLSVGAAPPTVLQPLRIDDATFSNLKNDAGNNLVAGDAHVRGSGKPGAHVALWHEGERAGSLMSIDADGRWRLQAILTLPPGEQPFLVRMVDDGGDILDEGDVALKVPALPTLAASGGATDVDDVLLSGAAQPGATLVLFVNEAAIADVVAGDAGDWQHTLRLSAGQHHIVAHESNGLQSNEAMVHVALARPQIIDQRRDENGLPLAGFYGTGRALTQLDLVVAGAVVGQASVDQSGQWRCTCQLPPGEHTVFVRETTEPERESAPLTITVANPQKPFVPGLAGPGAAPFSCPDPSPPGVIEGNSYLIGCGETLSGIAVSLGVTVEDILVFNAQITDPPNIYFGQRLNIPAGAACVDDLSGP